MIVLITGATSGIGRDAAMTLARRGLRVLASGRSRGKLEALAEEARTAGVAIETVVLDVCDAASIEAARLEVDRLTQGHGVDALVNNAGYGQLGPLSEVSDADLRAQFETNVFGLMAVTRAFLPRMRERGRGRIINVSSMGGRITFPFFGAYHATKYAVEALSDALRQELLPFGIDVVLIEPGMIRTGFEELSVGSLLRYRTTSSPYAPVLARVEEQQARLQRFHAPVSRSSRAILRAVTARRPRARYMVTAHARLLLLLNRMLPARAWDWLVTVPIGLTRKVLVLKIVRQGK